MSEEQKIRVGQVWRRKRNGRLIRIVRQARSFDGSYYIDDWGWEGHDYKARGVSYGWYIRRDSELVTEAPDA